MKSGMNIEQRELILLPFPFSDKVKSSKKRPAIVLSNKTYNYENHDLICCAVTSQVLIEEKGLPFSSKDMESNILRHESVILPCRLFSPNKNIILKSLGKIKKAKAKEILDFLNLKIKLND